MLEDNKNYLDFLSDVKDKISKAKISVSRSVNKELISLYWNIG